MLLGRFWEPPSLDPASVRCYGNDTFCLVLAQKLGLELVSPPDNFLTSVPEALLKRSLTFIPLADAFRGAFPVFVKPAVPKQFSAKVFGTAEELRHEARDLPEDTVVIVSEVVSIEAELRTFVLNRRVQTSGVYEGTANEGMLKDFSNIEPVVSSNEPISKGVVGRCWKRMLLGAPV